MQPDTIAAAAISTLLETKSFQKCVASIKNKECDGKTLGLLQQSAMPECDKISFDKDAKSGYPCLKAVFTTSCYVGPLDLQRDIEGRLQIMKSAVEAAYAEATPDPSVLKVFNVPEFFFRGPYGSYELSSLMPSIDDSFSPL